MNRDGLLRMAEIRLMLMIKIPRYLNPTSWRTLSFVDELPLYRQLPMKFPRNIAMCSIQRLYLTKPNGIVSNGR